MPRKYYHNAGIELADGTVTTIYDMSEEEPTPSTNVQQNDQVESESVQEIEPNAATAATSGQSSDSSQSQQNELTQNVSSNDSTLARIKEGAMTDGDNIDGRLRIEFPDYGYERYVTDIANWQMQRTTFGSEPGWFYFKVFFNFNTNYGLLGGIMQTIPNAGGPVGRPEFDINAATEIDFTSSESQRLASINTAFGYLAMIKDQYKHDLIYDRLVALSKFAISLKDISLKTPWMIKSVSGLNNINSAYVNNFDKEKSIVLGFNEETMDSRVGTMLDLYKFACFDQINCREIIPANLRKFEMSIMVYHMPLKYYHTKALLAKESATKMTTKNFFKGILGVGEDVEFDGIAPSKTTTLNASTRNFGDLMSFKLFTFLNCEIDHDNLNEYYVDGMSNELPFKLGANTIKIKYDRVYEHRMNEWIEAMFGSDGFVYNNVVPSALSGISGNYARNESNIANNQYRKRLEAMRNRWYGKQSIIDYTDLLIAKYYRPGEFHVPGTSLKDLTTNIGGQLNKWFGSTPAGKISQKWGSLKDNISKTYHDFMSH